MASHENRALTEAEVREIAEYKRIIRFSEQVLAGTHPRIKIPSYFHPQSNFTHPPSAQPKLAKKATAPIPIQPQFRTMIYPTNWQRSSILARKRKRDEMEEMKWKTQAEEWDDPAEDGDDLQVWVGEMEGMGRKTQAEEWNEPAEDGDDLQVWVGI